MHSSPALYKPPPDTRYRSCFSVRPSCSAIPARLIGFRHRLEAYSPLNLQEDVDWPLWADRITSRHQMAVASQDPEPCEGLAPPPAQCAGGGRGAPSLQALCERAVATCHVEPRTALEVLQFADAAGATALRRWVQ